MPVLWSMRVLSATGIVVALAALAGGADAREASIYRGPCGEVVLPTGPTGLQAPVRIETSCGIFAVDEDGARFVSIRPTKIEDGLRRRAGRLDLLERGRVVWRSRGRRHPRHAVGAWLVRDGLWIAFQYYRSPLYLVQDGGPERAVSEAAILFGWSRAGFLLTATGDASAVVVRDRRGRRIRTLTEGSGSARFDKWSKTLLMISRGRLLRTDGRTLETVADVSRYGLGRWVEIVPLRSGRIALVGKRLVVLGSDGGVVATDPRGGSAPTESPAGAFATVSTRYFTNSVRIRDSVRLLRPGDHSSTLLFTKELRREGCGRFSGTSWRGEQLLYTTTEGHVVMIDTESGDHIDLAAAVARLPGKFLSAAWA
jgi:hypothetical protein